MSNFANLAMYTLQPELLTQITRCYRYIGRNELYSDVFKSNIETISEETLAKDTYFLSLLLGLEISESRMAVLINKEVTPKNKEELKIVNLKNCLSTIKHKAIQYSFNATDILDILNTIFGKNSTKYQTTIIPGNKKKNIPPHSLRYLFDCVIDEYTNYFTLNKYERIMLSLLTFVEFQNITPFTNYNEIGSVIALYYMLLRSEVQCFYYQSFFEIYYNNQEKFRKCILEASINYQDNLIKLHSLATLTFELINQAYLDVEKFKEQYSQFESLGKNALVQKTILQMEGTFTKEDIRRLNPYVSMATINRALNTLREEDYIRPLGVGRSAKWIRNAAKEVKISNLLN